MLETLKVAGVGGKKARPNERRMALRGISQLLVSVLAVLWSFSLRLNSHIHGLWLAAAASTQEAG